MLQLRYQFVRILGEIVDWRDAQKYRPKRPGILCWKSFNRRALFRAGFARPLEDVRVGTSPALPIKLAEIATGAGKVNAKEHAVKADVKISQQSHWPVSPSGEAHSSLPLRIEPICGPGGVCRLRTGKRSSVGISGVVPAVRGGAFSTCPARWQLCCPPCRSIGRLKGRNE
jgi:hypothetical protein